MASRSRTFDDVISSEELVGWQERYRKVAGFAADDLRKHAGASQAPG